MTTKLAHKRSSVEDKWPTQKVFAELNKRNLKYGALLDLDLFEGTFAKQQ